MPTYVHIRAYCKLSRDTVEIFVDEAKWRKAVDGNYSSRNSIVAYEAMPLIRAKNPSSPRAFWDDFEFTEIGIMTSRTPRTREAVRQDSLHRAANRAALELLGRGPRHRFPNYDRSDPCGCTGYLPPAS